MPNSKPRLAVVLGVRPDVIRASLILNALRARGDLDLHLIWSGQHYSDNLKDAFFRELEVAPPDIELEAAGATDAELVASIIRRLYPVLEEMKPDAVIFLGDTNTVIGSLAAAQCNLPIVHIEGCMRSYDWRMPEEKYRTTIDHMSDVIYAYFPEHKQQGVAEGLNPASIVVVQNLIVDVVQRYFFDRKSHYDEMASASFFARRGIERRAYYLLTCHRRENVQNLPNLRNIIALLATAQAKVFFPAGYRTQAQLKKFELALPANVNMVEPVGYDEMLTLMANARGVLTDSGTVVEETAILEVPAVQMRKSTERPQVYDCGAAVKFDPSRSGQDLHAILNKLECLRGKSWHHGLGDGHASERIVADLVERSFRHDGFRNHLPERYHIDIRRSYREDGL